MTGSKPGLIKKKSEFKHPVEQKNKEFQCSDIEKSEEISITNKETESKIEEISNGDENNASSNSSVLTEILSPRRAAATIHARSKPRLIKKKSELKHSVEQKNKEFPNPDNEKSEELSITNEETEIKSEEISNGDENNSSSNSSVLTEILSPWRAAAKLHAQRCKAKYIKEFGRDIHLHSDDSDTMIRLKEKLTPSYAQITDKQRLQQKHKNISKSIPTAFDEWLKNKNKELKKQNEKLSKQKQIKELREAAEEAKKAKKRNEKVEKWRTNREYFANEKRAITKIKEKYQMSQCSYINNMNKIPAKQWEKIRQAAEDMQHIEPLQLGRLEGQGNVDPGKYLTKYIVKPDPAFRARYKYILEAAAARPTEIILDGDHNENVEDPAQLPRKILWMFRDEEKKIKELNRKNSNSSLKKRSFFTLRPSGKLSSTAEPSLKSINGKTSKIKSGLNGFLCRKKTASTLSRKRQ